METFPILDPGSGEINPDSLGLKPNPLVGVRVAGSWRHKADPATVARRFDVWKSRH